MIPAGTPPAASNPEGLTMTAASNTKAGNPEDLQK